MAKGELKLDDKFTDINPDELPPELQESYKNMQSHFTKRVTEAVESKKTYDTNLGVFTDEKAALEKELKELKTANQTLQTSLDDKSGGGGGEGDDDILAFLNEIDKGNGGGGGRSAEDEKLISTLTSTVTKLSKDFTDLKDSVDEKTSKAMKVIQYEHDLNAVSTLYNETFDKKLDRQKLIDFAIENKTPDLNQAYEMFTRDDTIEKKATERADTLFKERMEKDEDFASGSGPVVPKLFARDDKTPKTMSEATANILKEVRSRV